MFFESIRVLWGIGSQRAQQLGRVGSSGPNQSWWLLTSNSKKTAVCFAYGGCYVRGLCYVDEMGGIVAGVRWSVRRKFARGRMRMVFNMSISIDRNRHLIRCGGSCDSNSCLWELTPCICSSVGHSQNVLKILDRHGDGLANSESYVHGFCVRYRVWRSRSGWLVRRSCRSGWFELECSQRNRMRVCREVSAGFWLHPVFGW